MRIVITIDTSSVIYVAMEPGARLPSSRHFIQLEGDACLGIGQDFLIQ